MYVPDPNDSQTLEELKEYVEREFRKISAQVLIGETDTLEFKIWYELPLRPLEGLAAYLDNSIVGITTTGLHEYRGGAWVKL